MNLSTPLSKLKQLFNLTAETLPEPLGLTIQDFGTLNEESSGTARGFPGLRERS